MWSTVTDDFPTSTYEHPPGATHRTSPVRSVSVGPLVELSLSPRFSIEGNAITRSFRNVTEVVGACPTEEFRTCSWSGQSTGFWEFPVLAKYILSLRSWRPFLTVGPSFRTAKEAGRYGVAAGLGVEIPLKGMFSRVKIAPAVRFTHWSPDPGGSSSIFRNQVYALLGVSF